MGSSRKSKDTQSGHGFTVKRTHPRCMSIEWDGSEEKVFLLRSDAHHDNAHSDRDMELRHLREAKKIGAGIIDIGDIFDLMGGKWDPRKAPDHARLEVFEDGQQGIPYYDSIMSRAVSMYRPFAKNWLMMSPGNHEDTFKKKNETDPCSSLVSNLNVLEGSAIERMPYQGWIILRARCKGKNYFTYKIHYTHGWGGGGIKSKGLLQNSTISMWVGDADMVLMGHIHERYEIPYGQDRCSSHGTPYTATQMHVRLPTYKDEYTGEGFHIHKGRPPKPLGCALLKIRPYEQNFEGGSVKTMKPHIDWWD